MRSVRILLLILLAILAINAATLHVPSREVKRNTTAALYRRTRTLIPLKSLFHNTFLAVVKFGTPEQTFYLIIDTGSSYAAVADSFCTNCGSPSSIPVYNGGNSTTFHDLQQDFNVGFMDKSSISGTWTLDVATLGDIQVTLPFGRITNMDRDWVVLEISGVLGLRVGDPTTRYHYPFPSTLQTLEGVGHLDENVIGCRLVKNDNDQAGELLIGGVDTTHVDGPIHYTPVLEVDGQPDWLIPIDDLQIYGRSIAKGKNAYIDTGCNFVGLPGPILDDLFDGTGAQRQADGRWAVPYPFPSDVTFVISGQQFVIPRNDIPWREVQYGRNLYLSNIQDDRNGEWCLGVPFIANQYVAFDFGKNAIGIGKRNDYPPSPPPPRLPYMPGINPEAIIAARALINELWPDLEDNVRQHPILAGNYARIIESFEEAAMQAGNVAQTRIGKEILSRLTVENRENVAKLLQIEYGVVDIDSVTAAANQVMAADQNPEMTDEVIQSEVSGLMSRLGFRINGREIFNMLQSQLVALFTMSLIIRKPLP